MKTELKMLFTFRVIYLLRVSSWGLSLFSPPLSECVTAGWPSVIKTAVKDRHTQTPEHVLVHEDEAGPF